jgi:hypothetical protein
MLDIAIKMTHPFLVPVRDSAYREID